tara:strand:+ start:63 stop:599 length:537 start_codon:yes stop_codon:yes gene_type:complete
MNLKTYIQIDSFNKLFESYLKNKNIDYQEPFKISNYNEIKRKHGVYLIWHKEKSYKKLENLIYIGCSGKLKKKPDNEYVFITKQTLRSRFSAGHSPRRLSLNGHFFGLNPIFNVAKIDKEKLQDNIEIYKKTFPLNKIKTEILYFKDIKKEFSPSFVERSLIDCYKKNTGQLPLGNSK